MSAVHTQALAERASRLTTTASGAVDGAPRTVLRLEGAVALAAAVAAYGHTGHGWIFFALWFLVPDLSMLGYLAGPRLGAAAYNIGHSYLSPALFWALAQVVFPAVATPLALVWAAHIGFDRMLGYGLKHAAGFRATHLGMVGRSAL
jgi:hypothetical protein